MKAMMMALAGLVMLLAAPASGVAAHLERTKSGPVTLIGVASHVKPSGFTLTTNTHGVYQVVVSSGTVIDEKGHSGRMPVHEGDHVTVRGFVHERTITAIHIRIRVLKPKKKLYDIVGNVSSVSSSQITVAVSGKSTSVHLTPSTPVRIGSHPGSVAQIHRGDRVQVRVQEVAGTRTAVHIRVYVTTPGFHVQIKGQVTAVGGGSVTVTDSGKRYVVILSSQTVVYLGTELANAGALKPGQQVTVFACCQGGTLTATSIHISKSSTVQRAVTLRGRVVGSDRGVLRLITATGVVSVAVPSTTPVSLGTSPDTPSDIRIGDDISVRAFRSGSSYRAERIHIYVASRKPHTVVGTVARVSGAAVLIHTAAGKQVSIAVDRGTVITVGKQPGHISDIKPGSKVHVVARPAASGLVAISVRVSAAKAALKTVAGTLVSAGSGQLVIVSSSGAQYHVKLGPGVQVQLDGHAAPPDALFAGAKVKAKGTLTGQSILASTVTLTLRSVTATGRVVSLGRGYFSLEATRSRQVRVDVPPHARFSDGGKIISAGVLSTGAYVQVQGWEEATDRVQASAVQVTHPQVTLSAVVVSVAGSTVTVQTTAGARYAAKISSTTSLSSSRTHVPLQPQEIPAGAHVHLVGTVGSDGSVNVIEMTVTLSAETVRGQITALDAKSIVVATGISSVRGRLTPATTFVQGTRLLVAADVVTGDDVTLYGYRIATGVLVRKVDVHRARVTITGSIASLTSDGFTVTALDGTDRVILGTATVVTGGAPAVGATVHVSGYRRGDGVILAVTVKVAPAKPAA